MFELLLCPEQENKKEKLSVLDPALVNKFKMMNPTWKSMHPSEWGKKLQVDYILDIHLDKMSLYQPGTEIYDGRADVTVDVYEVENGTGEPKYNYVLPFSYPHTGILDATSIPQNRFKQDYLEHLASEISMKHAEHKQGSGIAEDR